MRRILVESAPSRMGGKRGGILERQELAGSQPETPELDGRLIAGDEALDKLAEENSASSGDTVQSMVYVFEVLADNSIAWLIRGNTGAQLVVDNSEGKAAGAIGRLIAQ